jgi:transposase
LECGRLTRCHNAAQLLREIRLQGFDGARTIVKALIATLRHAAGLPARSRRAGGVAIQSENMKRRLSCRTLAWMSTQPPHELDEAQRSRLTQIANLHPALKTAFTLAASFAGILRGHTPEALDDWLIAATQSNLKPLQSLASGIRADLAAVRAAIVLPWSNGRTEGYVNRLKCLKRHMYGRAKLDLLRIRLMAT